MLERVLDYVSRRTTDALPVLSFSLPLSLHTPETWVSQQAEKRVKFTRLCLGFHLTWLTLPRLCALWVKYVALLTTCDVTSLHRTLLSRSQNIVFCAPAHCTPVRNRVNGDRGRGRKRKRGRERSSHWVGTLFLGENCEESVENEIVTESARVAVECCVVWRFGWTAARLVVQWESNED